jgi:hypothetical protein
MLRAAAIALVVVALPLNAKDSLGVFDDWAAFRDPQTPRCYAIAMPQPSRSASDYRAYASVGTWPARGVRGQVHLRLSRKVSDTSSIVVAIGRERFRLSGGGGDAWATDKAMDAALSAAMRSNRSMSVSAIDARGRRFTDRYSLSGAATAMDAATVGCAKVRPR